MLFINQRQKEKKTKTSHTSLGWKRVDRVVLYATGIMSLLLAIITLRLQYVSLKQHDAIDELKTISTKLSKQDSFSKVQIMALDSQLLSIKSLVNLTSFYISMAKESNKSNELMGVESLRTIMLNIQSKEPERRTDYAVNLISPKWNDHAQYVIEQMTGAANNIALLKNDIFKRKWDSVIIEARRFLEKRLVMPRRRFEESGYQTQEEFDGSFFYSMRPYYQSYSELKRYFSITYFPLEQLTSFEVLERLRRALEQARKQQKINDSN